MAEKDEFVSTANLTGWLMLLCWLSAAEVAAESTRPNVVLILSDDHTAADSTVYGSAEVRTPQMARLAAAGMTFDAAFVASPSCAPSRAALLTGMYPQHNGAEANHAAPYADLKKWPAYFQELGYEVVAFGKVGHYQQTKNYGFDLSEHNGYHEDVAIPKACDWLRQRTSQQPLCLCVGTNWPHVPWPESPEGYDPATVMIPPVHADTPQTRLQRANYLSAIGRMDTDIGRVLDAVAEQLGDNTIICHTSDHGAQWPFGKWNLYDTGTRTPLIVSWPGHIAPGTRTPALVSWIDILPTLLELAGGQIPAGIDGQSFAGLLTGAAQSHRETIFTTHSGDGNMNVFPARAARDGRFKYIRNLRPEFKYTSHVTRTEKAGYYESWVAAAAHDPRAAEAVRRYHERTAEELFDVESDPLEQHNLIDDPAFASHRDRLRGQLDQWLQTTTDTLTVFGTPTLRQSPARQPNVVLVFIDDMGHSDLSCFGGDDASTPQIDRLAEEGLRFTNFYVNMPICSPSRVALTTGQYPQRHRIDSFLNNRQANEDRGMAQWLNPNVPVLARELKAVGYATGHFGKWHMGGQRDVGDAPLITEYGFLESLTNFEGLGPRVLPLCDAFDGREPKRHALGSDNLGRGPIRWADRSIITGEFVAAAVQFIDAAAAKGQPFYINVWPDDVHSPFFPPAALLTSSAKRDLYVSVLEAMDTQLAVLFDRIRNDPRLRENTLIVVASDNGPEPGAGTSDPFRGHKGQLYEGGIRSPLIVWSPALLNPAAVGTINETAVCSAIDLNVSLYGITGASSPTKAQDGAYIPQTFLGFESSGRTPPIFWRRPPDRGREGAAINPDLAIRAGDWKLLVQFDGSSPQLYRVSTDITEQQNLAAEMPALVDRLRGQLLTWNATLPQFPPAMISPEAPQTPPRRSGAPAPPNAKPRAKAQSGVNGE